MVTAQVGGIGMMPSANIGDGVAVFEVTHGPLPSLIDKTNANPTAMILAGEMLLRYIGWNETADIIRDGYRQIAYSGSS